MRKKILNELCRRSGDFVSGKEMAEEMGISRVAVWKHIEVLKEEGYNIQGVSGRGYRIDNVENILLLDEVKKRLSTKFMGNDLRYYTEVDSTNNKSKQLLKKGEIEPGAVIAAMRQSEGKGRRGREWESPVGGLWFSLLTKPGLALQQTALLSLVFAVAVACALDKFLPFPTSIKWPNDVFVHDKKIAGILLELSGELEQADYLITGIGINVNIKNSELGKEIGKKASSLLEETGDCQRLDIILAEVLNTMEEYYYNFMDNGFEKILYEFKERCFHLGKDVKIQLPGKTVQGLNTDIDEQGNLLIRSENKVERLSTGDVFLINFGEVNRCT